MIEDEIKDQLHSSSYEFRQLIEEHNRLENKLLKLQGIPHWTAQDRANEVTFKKRKLQLKDEMNAMIQKFRNGQLSHQHS